MSEIKVLDHGYVKLVEAWGSDEAIVEAARQSTQKGFLGWGPVCEHCGGELTDAFVHADPTALKCFKCGTVSGKPGDEKLLKFMWENQHSTPFEFGGMTIEVQAPIFVFREWHRHRTQSYSEASARYSPLPDVNYVPTIERLIVNGQTNKQAGTIKDADVLTATAAGIFQDTLRFHYEGCEKLYRAALSAGVPKELARVVLPVGRYSRMRASTDLRNWLGFLKLRQAPNAQQEIRIYADAVAKILGDKFPRTMALFNQKDPLLENALAALQGDIVTWLKSFDAQVVAGSESGSRLAEAIEQGRYRK